MRWRRLFTCLASSRSHFLGSGQTCREEHLCHRSHGCRCLPRRRSRRRHRPACPETPSIRSAASSLTSRSRSPTGAAWRTTRCGPIRAGHFEIEGLAPGDYLLEAERSGFTTAHDSLTVGPGDHLHHEVTLLVAPFEEHVVVTSGVTTPGRATQRVAPTGCVLVRGQRGEVRGVGHWRRTGTAGPDPHCAAGIPAASSRRRHQRRRRHRRPRRPPKDELTGARVIRTAHADLAAASVAAIEQWRWTAPRLDCVPIEASLTITVEFRIGP